VLRISIRSLLAHKLRMAMSVFAVVLGTAFISGALVFGNALGTILDGAFTGSAVDLRVDPKPAVDAGAFGPASTVTLKDEVVGRLRSVPGVADAQGTVDQLGVYVLDAQNKVQYRRVTTGALQEDGLRVITQGLDAEDWVLVGGLPQVRPHTAVQPEARAMPTLGQPPAAAPAGQDNRPAGGGQ
jgi:hypothetical protein